MLEKLTMAVRSSPDQNPRGEGGLVCKQSMILERSVLIKVARHLNALQIGNGSCIFRHAICWQDNENYTKMSPV